MGLYKKMMVGIFSRESDETYYWIIDLLLSPQFRSAVQDVRPVLVSNTVCGHSAQLTQEIDKCNFAILYHTKKRGRLNVTDVTDSLYDQELRHLSEKLAQKVNVPPVLLIVFSVIAVVVIIIIIVNEVNK